MEVGSITVAIINADNRYSLENGLQSAGQLI